MSKWNYDKPILPHENEITKQRRQEDIDQMLEVLGMIKRKEDIEIEDIEIIDGETELTNTEKINEDFKNKCVDLLKEYFYGV